MSNKGKNNETPNANSLATQIISSLDGETFGSKTITDDEPVDMNAADGADPHRDFSRTVIDFEEDNPKEGNGSKSEERRIIGRKLVGWLVSYDIDTNGVDFRLYEGRNLIGRDLNCEVCINDPKISGHHAVIRYLQGKFEIKDEFSSNGTRVNGDYIDYNKSIELRDGDPIIVGDTMLIFRRAIKLPNE